MQACVHAVQYSQSDGYLLCESDGLLHYTTQEITNIIDLGKVWLPLNSLGLHPQLLLGQPDFPAVYNVSYCPRVSAITNTCMCSQ